MNSKEVELELQVKREKKLQEKKVGEILMSSNKIFKSSVVDEYLSGEIWDNVFLVHMPVVNNYHLPVENVVV